VESIKVELQFSESQESSVKSEDTSNQRNRPTPTDSTAARPALTRRPHSSPQRRRGLKARDRALLAALALCRYLTLEQVQRLFGRGHPKVVGNRLRALAGDTGNVLLPDLGTVALRRLRFRAFDGAPLVLWTPTPTGYLLARRELGREVKVPRTDVGAAFAEHVVALTDLFVALAGPYVRAGVPVRDLPFSWDVTEETHLPWREPASDGTGRTRDRVLLPDAVLEIPSARRRVFIECETGSHSLAAVSRDKPQATIHKAARYETFLAGLADVASRTTHYAQKYPDGWPAEVLFLVPTEARRLATEAALAKVLVAPDKRFAFHPRTLEGALAHVWALLPLPPEHGVPPISADHLYGPEEHRTVSAFVVELTEALVRANALLRRHAEAEVPDAPSTARMLAFLRKAQAAMHEDHGPGASGA
jgi:Replication-relaxation